MPVDLSWNDEIVRDGCIAMEVRLKSVCIAFERHLKGI